jgi:hypothetical protein
MKCDCVSGTKMDGSGPEYADPDCEICYGTGRVGMTFAEVDYWELTPYERAGN